MNASDLALSVERHCTSKLVADLSAIETLGFGGEALASIGAVARLRVASRPHNSEYGWQLTVERGKSSEISPAAMGIGTEIEIADLFFSMPARLKFMKSERAESTAVSETVRQIAMAHPHIRFTLSGSHRNVADYMTTDSADPWQRIEQAIGKDFRDNALAIESRRDDIRLTGFAALPTFNRGNTARQYFYVNGRPVRDKQLLGALRGAYADFLPRHRHPVAALFLTLTPAEVDVNVHPAKAEVRFRDPGGVRGLIVGSLRQALAVAGHRATTTGGAAMQSAFHPGRVVPGPWSDYGRPLEPPTSLAKPSRPRSTMSERAPISAHCTPKRWRPRPRFHVRLASRAPNSTRTTSSVRPRTGSL